MTPDHYYFGQLYQFHLLFYEHSSHKREDQTIGKKGILKFH